MPEQLNRIEAKLTELQTKIEATFVSAEKTRKYMMWTAIITIAVIVIPLLLLPLVIPAFLSSVALPAGF
jgi:type II secretory pathway component PulF